MSDKRLLPPETIPSSLWDAANNRQSLSGHLAVAYKDALARHGLLSGFASYRDAGRQIGGAGKDEAHAHFAARFGGSAGRSQLAVLDPKSELADIPNSVLSLLAGGDLMLVDLASGAGALSLTLLAVTAELREKQVVPREALNVNVFAADISPDAHQLMNELLECIRPWLEDQAIFVTLTATLWDAGNEHLTAALATDLVVQSSLSDRGLLAVGGLSGYLGKDGNRTVSESPIRMLLVLWDVGHRHLLWVEPHDDKPDMKDVLKKYLLKVFRWVASVFDPEDEPAKSETAAAVDMKPSVSSTLQQCPIDDASIYKVRGIYMTRDRFKRNTKP